MSGWRPEVDILTLKGSMGENWKNHYIDNAVHHVTGTVHGWQPVLLCPNIIRIFEEEFNRMIKRWSVDIIGYVIMPEHFHMMIQSDQGNYIMRFIQSGRRYISGRVRKLIESKNNALNSYFSYKDIDLSAFYSKTAGKSNFRFWKEKPRVFPISKEEDVLKKLDYIHNNPVRRGLVQSPGDWGYSSYGFYEDGTFTKLIFGYRRQDVVNSILTHRQQ